MKTIIAGSRDIKDSYNKVVEAVEASGFNITEVVSGTARGIDRAGETWALVNKIPLKRFPAEWDVFGLVAGRMRNIEMAKYAEALIAVWDGISSGTGHMIDTARARGLKIYVHLV